ncbi:hypothetical protein [uncultured Streptomyces sp.]|uniref:hypothetical protein n=1 Tax=uncultured Streptomyces sp. TaxID=174707 RepID=UPI00261826E5|nr:hypothetical protein [uncultured Streptomyces sp.]
MRAAVVRRTALAASAVTLALLVSACGGSSDDDAKGAGKSAAAGSAASKSDAAASDVKALSAAELEKASLTAADLKGYQVTTMKDGERGTADQVTVDKAECLPVALALGLVEREEAVASTARQAMPKPDASAATADDPLAAISLVTSAVSLSSYDGADASEVLAEMKKTAAECTGFTATVQGEKTVYSKVAEVPVSGGEEALGLNLAMESDGDSVPMSLVLVRQAGTVATIATADMSGATGGTAENELPTEIISAQVAKLA